MVPDKLPYYSVIFSSTRTPGDNGYSEISKRMVEFVAKQEGYLGYESYRNPDGKGVTISYWKDLESIRKWKANEEHLLAQKGGKEQWYSRYKVRICKVEREYEFEKK